MTCEISDVTMSTMCMKVICTNEIVGMVFNWPTTYTYLWHLPPPLGPGITKIIANKNDENFTKLGELEGENT